MRVPSPSRRESLSLSLSTPPPPLSHSHSVGAGGGQGLRCLLFTGSVSLGKMASAMRIARVGSQGRAFSRDHLHILGDLKRSHRAASIGRTPRNHSLRSRNGLRSCTVRVSRPVRLPTKDGFLVGECRRRIRKRNVVASTMNSRVRHLFRRLAGSEVGPGTERGEVGDDEEGAGGTHELRARGRGDHGPQADQARVGAKAQGPGEPPASFDSVSFGFWESKVGNVRCRKRNWTS